MNITKETQALLEILKLGNRQIEQGKTMPAKEAIRRIREQAKRS